MGISFRGLTSSALVAGSEKNVDGNNKDIATVPASVEHATSVDLPRGQGYDEKIGAPHTVGTDSDTDSREEDFTKIDEKAPEGVMVAQALTHVWSKRDLLIAYALSVSRVPAYHDTTLTIGTASG